MVTRCASAIQIVPLLESIAETQPQLQPTLLRLPATIPITSTRNGKHVAVSRGSRPKPSDCEIVVPQMSRTAGKDLQPERFEQSHAQDVLVFVTDGDVVKENSFQLETKPAVEIDIAHVDVARVDVNLV